jgi:hypothetical protein
MSICARTHTQTHAQTTQHKHRGDTQHPSRGNVNDRLGQVSHSQTHDHSRDRQRRSQTDRAPSDPHRRERTVPRRGERLEHDDEASSSRSRGRKEKRPEVHDRRTDRQPDAQFGRRASNDVRHQQEGTLRTTPPAPLPLPPPPPVKRCRNSHFTGVDPSSPFSEEIVSAPYPDGFTAPKLTRYDGKSDPSHFVRNFVRAMKAYRPDEMLYCNVLPTYFDGPALAWFNQLPPRSVWGWEQFVEMLVSRFYSSTYYQKSPDSIMNLRQHRDESLIDTAVTPPYVN